MLVNYLLNCRCGIHNTYPSLTKLRSDRSKSTGFLGILIALSTCMARFSQIGGAVLCLKQTMLNERALECANIIKLICSWRLITSMKSADSKYIGFVSWSVLRAFYMTRLSINS